MQSEDTNHPEELLSAAFDGEYDSAIDVPPERRAKLEQDWEAIRSGLQAVPSASVDLVSLVRTEIAESEQPPVVVRESNALRRNSLLIAIPGLISIAAVLLFGVLPLLQDSDMAHQAGSLNLASVATASDWDVVVVNLSDDTKLQDSVRAVLGAAEQHGAGIEQLGTENDVGAEYSAGILLADGGDPEAIVNSLEQNQQLEWNPPEIDGRSHEEIKQLFLSSMEIPSQSEKAFGTMYIVREDSLAVTAMPLERDVSSQVAGGKLAKTADSSALEQPSATGRSMMAPVPADKTVAADKPRTPLVVIFRRSAQPPKPAVVPDQGSLPVKTRIKPTV